MAGGERGVGGGRLQRDGTQFQYDFPLVFNLL